MLSSFSEFQHEPDDQDHKDEQVDINEDETDPLIQHELDDQDHKDEQIDINEDEIDPLLRNLSNSEKNNEQSCLIFCVLMLGAILGSSVTAMLALAIAADRYTDLAKSRQLGEFNPNIFDSQDTPDDTENVKVKVISHIERAARVNMEIICRNNSLFTSGVTVMPNSITELNMLIGSNCFYNNSEASVHAVRVHSSRPFYPRFKSCKKVRKQKIARGDGVILHINAADPNGDLSVPTEKLEITENRKVTRQGRDVIVEKTQITKLNGEVIGIPKVITKTFKNFSPKVETGEKVQTRFVSNVTPPIYSSTSLFSSSMHLDTKEQQCDVKLQIKRR